LVKRSEKEIDSETEETESASQTHEDLDALDSDCEDFPDDALVDNIVLQNEEAQKTAKSVLEEGNRVEEEQVQTSNERTEPEKDASEVEVRDETPGEKVKETEKETKEEQEEGRQVLISSLSGLVYDESRGRNSLLA